MNTAKQSLFLACRSMRPDLLVDFIDKPDSLEIHELESILRITESEDLNQEPLSPRRQGTYIYGQCSHWTPVP